MTLARQWLCVCVNTAVGPLGDRMGSVKKDFQVICPVISSSSFDYVGWTVLVQGSGFLRLKWGQLLGNN